MATGRSYSRAMAAMPGVRGRSRLAEQPVGVSESESTPVNHPMPSTSAKKDNGQQQQLPRCRHDETKLLPYDQKRTTEA